MDASEEDSKVPSGNEALMTVELLAVIEGVCAKANPAMSAAMSVARLRNVEGNIVG